MNSTQPFEDATPAPSEPRRSLPGWAPWAIGGFAGFLLGVGVSVTLIALGGAATQIAADTRLVDAEATCGSGPGVDIEDDGRTLIFEMKGEDEASGAPYSAFECISAELDMPASVTSHIGQTTSQDGRQSEQWDGIEFSWSYHPDRGLDGLFVLLDQ